jgi:ferredoxin
MALAQAFLDGLGYAGARLHLLATGDPDLLAERLAALAPVAGIASERFGFAGGKRDIARTALSRLHAAAPKPVERMALPTGAPYGRIVVDTQGCTLCLACVGACPANALADHPEKPQLAFTEAACVQCGVCVATCPEKVIALAPGYDFTPAAMAPAVLKSEEPFHCVSCGKPFGTKSTIERVTARLKGRHAMFQNAEQLRLIQMCDTCRVVALSAQGNDPMRLGERPRVRTTEDYLAEAKEEQARAKPAGGKKPDDFLG